MDERLRQLLDLAHRQREALNAGLWDAFCDLMAERTRLFEALKAEAAGQPLRPEWAQVMAEVVRIDGHNAAVIEAFLRELADRASAVFQLEAGAAAYLHSGAAADSGDLLDGKR